MKNQALRDKLLKGKGADQISDEELRQIGYVKMKFGDITHILDKEALEKNKASAMGLLSKANRGYLYAHNRENLRYFLSNKKILSSEILRIIKARVKKVRENNIPPIFQEDFEGSCEPLDYRGLSYYRFPAVDFLINLFNSREKWCQL